MRAFFMISSMSVLSTLTEGTKVGCVFTKNTTAFSGERCSSGSRLVNCLTLPRPRITSTAKSAAIISWLGFTHSTKSRSSSHCSSDRRDVSDWPSVKYSYLLVNSHIMQSTEEVERAASSGCPSRAYAPQLGCSSPNTLGMSSSSSVSGGSSSSPSVSFMNVWNCSGLVSASSMSVPHDWLPPESWESIVSITELAFGRRPCAALASRALFSASPSGAGGRMDSAAMVEISCGRWSSISVASPKGSIWQKSCALSVNAWP
mmetsp:Transcript_16759/g.50041  ORF Transcript_16759/g.50041 Transcript_16759/m.50041 type:complete len:260 (-) Transcript_16759:59-838(-)